MCLSFGFLQLFITWCDLQVYLIALCVCLYYCRGELQQAFLAAEQQQVWAGGGLSNHRFVRALPNQISAVGVIQLWCFGPLQGAWITESSDMEAISCMFSFYSDLLQFRTSGAELRGGSLFGLCSTAWVKEKLCIVIKSLCCVRVHVNGTFHGSRVSSVRHRLRGIFLLTSCDTINDSSVSLHT